MDSSYFLGKASPTRRAMGELRQPLRWKLSTIRALPIAGLLLLWTTIPSPAADLSRDDVSAMLAAASPDRPADLAGRSLAGLDLSGLDLRRAKLAGADLYGAKLVGADLRGAGLSGAIL